MDYDDKQRHSCALAFLKNHANSKIHFDIVMKPIISYSLLAALAATGFAVGQETVTAKTTPVGYVTTTLYGRYDNGSRKNNVVGPNLVNPVEFKGSVESISGNTVVLSSGSLTANAFNPSGDKYSYYVETADGYWSHIVSNDDSSLTLPEGYAANFSASDTILIRRHLTITDYFGANAAGLQANAEGDSSLADQIIIIDEDTGSSVIIFASDVLGGNWVTDAFDDADNYPLYPNQGVQVSRISDGELSLVLTGEVDTVDRQIDVNTGVNVRPIVSPVDTSLGELGLYTGEEGGLVATASGDSSEADTVSIIVNGETRVYFYSSIDLSGEGAGWYDDSFNYVNDEVIPAGSAVIVNRVNPTNSSPFVWVNPAPVID